MYIKKEDKDNNYLIKYIDRNGTKEYKFWKTLIDNKKVLAFSTSNRRVTLGKEDFKTIFNIKKAADSFKLPWEFDFRVFRNKLLLLGFSFMKEEQLIQSETDGLEQSYTKREFIYHISLEVHEKELRVSQPSFSTSYYEDVLMHGKYLIHPHTSYSSFENYSDTGIEPFPYTSPFYRDNKISSNVCRGAGSVGMVLTSALLQKNHSKELIQYYITNFLTLGSLQSESGGPYWRIKNIQNIEQCINLKLGRSKEFVDTMRRLGLSYTKDIENISDRIYREGILPNLKELRYDVDAYRGVVLVEDSAFETFVLSKIISSDIDKISYVDFCGVKVSVSDLVTLKRLFSKDIEKSKKLPKVVIKVIEPENYFIYEGKKYPMKRATVNPSYAPQDFKQEILEISRDSAVFNTTEIINNIKQKINEYIQHREKILARKSFKRKIQGSIESRERSLFEDTGTVFQNI